MKAIILSGGKATRLRPLTCNIPKVMVPVLNRPLLEHLLSYIKKHGVVDIMLALGKKIPDQIQSYFGDGSKFGVRMRYSTEKFPLGTAGAIKNAESFLNEPFIVFNGDIFTDIDLTAMLNLHQEKKALATIALTPVDNPTVYGVGETDSEQRVRCFIEKPAWDKVSSNMINAGIYVLEPDILNPIPPETFSTFEHDIFPLLLKENQPVYSYPSQEYWIDIGTPEKYLRLNHDLLCRHSSNKAASFEGKVSLHQSSQIEGPVVIGEGCTIDRNSVIRGPAAIGQECRIGEDAVIEGSLLWQGCTIGKRVKLKNCVLATNCYIAEENILEDCVLGENVRVGTGNKLSRGMRIWPDKSIEPRAVSL